MLKIWERYYWKLPTVSHFACFEKTLNALNDSLDNHIFSYRHHSITVCTRKLCAFFESSTSDWFEMQKNSQDSAILRKVTHCVHYVSSFHLSMTLWILRLGSPELFSKCYINRLFISSLEIVCLDELLLQLNFYALIWPLTYIRYLYLKFSSAFSLRVKLLLLSLSFISTCSSLNSRWFGTNVRRRPIRWNDASTKIPRWLELTDFYSCWPGKKGKCYDMIAIHTEY